MSKESSRDHVGFAGPAHDASRRPRAVTNSGADGVEEGLAAGSRMVAPTLNDASRMRCQKRASEILFFFSGWGVVTLAILA